jgi:hypothetical protein
MYQLGDKIEMGKVRGDLFWIIPASDPRFNYEKIMDILCQRFVAKFGQPPVEAIHDGNNWLLGPVPQEYYEGHRRGHRGLVSESLRLE